MRPCTAVSSSAGEGNDVTSSLPPSRCLMTADEEELAGLASSTESAAWFRLIIGGITTALSQVGPNGPVLGGSPAALGRGVPKAVGFASRPYGRFAVFAALVAATPWSPLLEATSVPVWQFLLNILI